MNNERDLFINKIKEFFNDFENLDEKDKKEIENALDFFINAYKKRKRNDLCHSIYHFYNVLNLSLKIIKNEKIVLEKDSIKNLVIAILFHDIGQFFVEKTKDLEESIKLFNKFAKKNNLDEKDIKEIIDAIKNHSYSKGSKSGKIISKILYDADKLDVIGQIFFYRTSVYDNGKKYLLNYKIGRKYLDYLDLIKKGKIGKEDCKKIFNDKNFVIDHYFIKAFWLKEKLNFEFSKKEFNIRRKKTERAIYELINEIF